jgi:hypothetical protein
VRPWRLSIGLVALSCAFAVALVTIPAQAQQQQRSGGGIVLGYYVPYDAASWTSLEDPNVWPLLDEWRRQGV